MIKRPVIRYLNTVSRTSCKTSRLSASLYPWTSTCNIFRAREIMIMEGMWAKFGSLKACFLSHNCVGFSVLINQYEYCLESCTQFDLVFSYSSQLNWDGSVNMINKHGLSWITTILAFPLMDIVICEIKKSIISFIKMVPTLSLRSLKPLIDVSCEKWNCMAVHFQISPAVMIKFK